MSSTEEYPAYGTWVKRPLRIQCLRYASVVLAGAGLVLLWLYSIHRDIPVVKVGDITPTMNFSTVRMAGKVLRDAYIFKSGGLVFDIGDDSGEIAVMGGRAQARVLKEAGKLPRKGDRIEVVGSLSVGSGQEMKLCLQSADQLHLQRTRFHAPDSVTEFPLSEIGPEQRGKWVRITGSLKTIELPSPGSRAPYKLMIEEKGTVLPVVFWDDAFQGDSRALPMPGKRIRVCGRVGSYNDELQIKLQHIADLRVMEPNG